MRRQDATQHRWFSNAAPRGRAFSSAGQRRDRMSIRRPRRASSPHRGPSASFAPLPPSRGPRGEPRIERIWNFTSVERSASRGSLWSLDRHGRSLPSERRNSRDSPRVIVPRRDGTRFVRGAANRLIHRSRNARADYRTLEDASSNSPGRHVDTENLLNLNVEASSRATRLESRRIRGERARRSCNSRIITRDSRIYPLRTCGRSSSVGTAWHRLRGNARGPVNRRL